MLPRLAAAFAVVFTATAQTPLPQLRIEAVEAGSVLYVRNVAAQPLTAFLIELVNYPGSSFSLWQDDLGNPIAPGAEQRIPVNNMLVGAAPDYVKLQAALYADGTAAGIPERAAQFVERRRALLTATRDLIQRLEKHPAKDALAAELKQTANSMPVPSRNSQAAINQEAVRGLLLRTAARVEKEPIEDTLTYLRTSERTLASSKPPL